MKIRFSVILLLLTTSSLYLNAQQGDILKSEAIMYEGQGNYPKAAITYEKATIAYENENLTDTLSIYKAGQSYSRCKHYDKALPFLIKCDDLNYQEPNLYITLSQAYTGNKDLKKAEEALLKGQEMYPNHKKNYIKQISYFYYNSRQFDKACAALSTALENNPNDLNSLYLYGSSLERLKKYDEASDALLQIMKLDESNTKAVKKLGIVYFKKTDNLLQKETKRYEAIAKPSRVDYSNTVKKLDQIKEGYKKALPYLEKAYETSPNDKTIASCLKVVYKRLKMDDKAVQL
ncbi:tetratricopeptide repeat protein [Saccharicrinis sp. GN24d3]|uniref:tetratricopeptide repeat protein n=1 Tax=Saccharicrinis sp. GN24d3 TaxID=3458416 RepID=UPI0040375704